MSTPTNESANFLEKNVIKEENRKRKYDEEYDGEKNAAEAEDKEQETENELKEENDESAEENAKGKVVLGDSREVEDESAEEEEFVEEGEDSSDESDSNDTGGPEYYEEDDLPNINFPKFVIPRVPGSDFPTDVLKHMKKNAPPRTALKLMQICKFFCDEEFPFLPMKYIKYYADYGFSYQALQGEEVEYADHRIVKLFKKKLWMTDEINLDYITRINFFLRYIVACDLQELCLEGQKLSIEQFKFLTFGGKIKKFCLRSVTLNYENGDPVPLEEILKFVPIVEEFSFKRSSIYHENVANFIPFLNTTTLNFFALGALTEKFNFEAFIDFITIYPKIQFSLKFKEGLSDEFFQKLQTFVEDTRKAGSYSRYVFSRIYCKNKTWRYGADPWYVLPDIFCKCGHLQTLRSNYEPPYFRCSCDKYLKSTEAWNKEFHRFYE